MVKWRSWYCAMVVPMVGLVLWLSGTVVVAGERGEKPDGPATVKQGQVKPLEDGCWAVETTQNFSSVDDGFFGTTAISANDVWAVGTYDDSGIYQPLTMHWDGVRWRLISSPYPAGLYSYLRGVSGVASDDVWAVGYSETQNLQLSTLILHWNGTQWSIVPSPNGAGTNSVLLDVAVRAGNDVWAVGYSGTDALVLHWNGTEWSVVTTPAVAGSSTLSGVTALGGNNAWAVGRTYDATSAVTRTLTMRWNGSVWSVMPSPNPGPTDTTLNAVDSVSSSDVWAVGYYRDESSGEPRRLSLVLHWDGSIWSVVPSPNGARGNILLDVVGIASNDVWAVGYYVKDRYIALTMHWDGAAWTSVPAAYVLATGTVLNSVDGVLGGSLRAVGYSYSGVTSRTLAMRYDAICLVPTPTPVVTFTPTPSPTPCTPGSFSDVPPENTFYPQVTCLANRGIVSGYGDCTFRPNNEVTRGQLAKIVANAAGFSEPVSGQTFSDVPPISTFYEFIERMAARGIIGGYSDGTFRPGNSATRGQISKIVANAASMNEPVNGQRFTDVPPTHTFYEFIERMASRGIISGYSDGTFRPQNNATRGQTSKIVANTFYPDCQTSVQE